MVGASTRVPLIAKTVHYFPLAALRIPDTLTIAHCSQTALERLVVMVASLLEHRSMGPDVSMGQQVPLVFELPPPQ